MTNPKYATPLHRRLRATYQQQIDAGQGWCTETICLEEQDGRTRWIQPGQRWDLAHTDNGTAYKGPAHQRCNRADGARRGNRMRTNTNKPKKHRRIL